MLGQIECPYPGGVAFELATVEPGFHRDAAHPGEALELPEQHAHLGAPLEKHPQPLE